MNRKKIIWILLGLVGAICFYLVLVLGFWFLNKDKVYPGVSVAGINLGGKSKAEAKQVLDERAAKFLSGDLNFKTDKANLVKASDLGLSFNTEKTAQDALNVGAKNPFMLGVDQKVTLTPIYDKDKLFAKINEINAKNTTVAVNSKIIQQGDTLKVEEGKPGTRVNFTETTHSFVEAVTNLESNMEVKIFTVPPTFTQADLVGHEAEILKLASKKIVLTANGKSFEVAPATILSWIQLGQNQPEGSFSYNDPRLEAVAPSSSGGLISEDLVSGYLISLSEKINQTAINAQLAISGDRASVFTPSRDGVELDVAASSKEIITALENSENSVNLVVNTKKAEVNESSLNDLGINELISSGYSTFTGSPANRIHNIKTGSARFNGVLIKPNQSFSFLDALGPVDASTGYLPELVIKENKTVPEYGGGMCQVSSTAFRAALNAGLPILERKAHSYPVSYYKPYGVDASVYIPSPDLVFKNDTGHYILIQTHIEGTKLTFDFYGTKPQRTVKFAGNEGAAGAVNIVEKVSPLIYDKEARGRASFTAQIWRFIYDQSGKLETKNTWISKYDSPDKYPH